MCQGNGLTAGNPFRYASIYIRTVINGEQQLRLNSHDHLLGQIGDPLLKRAAIIGRHKNRRNITHTSQPETALNPL